MPFKKGPLKGKLTGAEIRKLISAHNKLASIKIPPGTTRDGLIEILTKNRYQINHEEMRIEPSSSPQKLLNRKITLEKAKEITKPAVKNTSSKTKDHGE